MSKCIFVTGVVVSGLEKDITAASQERLLKARGSWWRHRSFPHGTDKIKRFICLVGRKDRRDSAVCGLYWAAIQYINKGRKTPWPI